MIEVAVSLVVVGLGAATLTPALSTARQDARIPACAANLGIINSALGSLQQSYPGFYAPLIDEVPMAAYQNGVASTWIDVLQQLQFLPSRAPAYCPADRRPDALNAQRGLFWNFRYPAGLGGGDGMDYSYGLAAPFAAAVPADTSSGWDPETHPDRRVVAADGFWTFIHGMSGYAVARPAADATKPYWGGNTVGYRHKMSANALHRDGHVSLVAVWKKPVGTSGYTGYVDTSKVFVWRENEHPEVGYGSFFNTLDRNGDPYQAYPSSSYPAQRPQTLPPIPDALDPAWYSRYRKWTVPDIYEHKGWTRTAPASEGGAR